MTTSATSSESPDFWRSFLIACIPTDPVCCVEDAGVPRLGEPGWTGWLSRSEEHRSTCEELLRILVGLSTRGSPIFLSLAPV